MTIDDIKSAQANVHYTPTHSGDGYSFGGSAVLTIGPVAVLLGENPWSIKLAQEIAARWNAKVEKQ